MVTLKLATPITVGALTNQVTISSLAVTSAYFSTLPALAPLGAAELKITVTDPVSGWQEQIVYNDSSVVAFFDTAAPTPPTGATYADVLATAILTKLLADGKVPPGTIS